MIYANGCHATFCFDMYNYYMCLLFIIIHAIVVVCLSNNVTTTYKEDHVNEYSNKKKEGAGLNLHH